VKWKGIYGAVEILFLWSFVYSI